MKKHYFLFISIAIFLLMPLIFVKAESTLVYIGLEINNLYDGNKVGNARYQWCLSDDGNTTMEIKKGEEVVVTVVNNEAWGSWEGCDTDILWSGLIELDLAVTYDIVLSLPDLTSGGYFYNDALWFLGETGQNCNTVCANQGLTCRMNESQANDTNDCHLCNYFAALEFEGEEYWIMDCWEDWYEAAPFFDAYYYETPKGEVRWEIVCRYRPSEQLTTCSATPPWTDSRRFCDCLDFHNYYFSFIIE